MNNIVREFIRDKYEARNLRKASNLPKGKVILEIGCGDGSGTQSIQKYFHPQKIHGIDLDPRMIEVANKKKSSQSVSFSVGDVEKLKFKDNQFDAVMDFGVIHHVPNWKKGLRELKRVLKTDGEFILEDLSIDTFKTPAGKVFKRLLNHPYDSMYAEKEFIAYLKTVGFEITRYESRYPLGLMKYFVIVARKSKQNKKPINKNNSNIRKTINTYDQTVAEYRRNTDSLHPPISRKFLSLIPKAAKILDIGCGPGRDAEIFRKAGYEVIGIDLSANMISEAKHRVPKATFHIMNLTNLKFVKGSFDAVWANAALVHTPKGKMISTLRNIRQVLKKGGIFYLSVKRGTGEDMEQDKRYKNLPKFWSYFEIKEIKYLIEKAGFELLECSVYKQESKYATHPWIQIIAKKSKNNKEVSKT